MYFKILAGCETHEKLVALQARMQAANKAARALSETTGALGFAASSHYLAGGIAGLDFKQKPEGYKVVQSPNWFMPKSIKANNDLLQAIADLPKLANSELTSILNYKGGLSEEGGRMIFSSRPGVTWGDGWIAVDGGRGAGANPDMVEILESEYRALTAKPKPEPEPVEA